MDKFEYSCPTRVHFGEGVADEALGKEMARMGREVFDVQEADDSVAANAAVDALEVKFSPEEVDFLEKPYVAHELVGPKSRPGEKPLAGTTKVKLTK